MVGDDGAFFFNKIFEDGVKGSKSAKCVNWSHFVWSHLESLGVQIIPNDSKKSEMTSNDST